MPDNTCGDTLPHDGGDLTCNLEPDHYGPTHDDHGHQWGDETLPLSPVEPDED